MNAAEKTIKIIESVVRSVIKDMGLTNQLYHYGTIQKVHNDNSVDLYVDGASELKKYIPILQSFIVLSNSSQHTRAAFQINISEV